MTESSLCIGIDLGTTNSCVAYYKNDNVEILENGEGGRTTPSYLMFSDKNPVFVGTYAKKKSETYPEHGVYDIKRFIGRGFHDPDIQKKIKYLPFQIKNVSNKPVIVVRTKEKVHENTPERLSAYILTKIKTDVEAKLGETINKAVITVPAYFNVSQREATLKAADKAGFTVLKLLNEPTAAALQYYHKNESNVNDESYSLVYDLGGGTFDVAILKKTKTNVDIVCVDGDSHLGGTDFDNLIVNYVCNILTDVYGYNHNFNSRMTRRLKNKCEEAKIALSTVNETEIILEALFHKGDEPIEIPITRLQFENMADNLFRQTIEIIDKCLDNSKLLKSDIDEIILSGGSTRIPKIQEMISNYFDGKKLNKINNPDECVAQGAAIQAALLSTHQEQHINQVKITDVVPLSLGIQVLGGFMDFVIKKNTSIPSSGVRSFYNVGHKQKSIKINIYEGERIDAKKNYFLGNFVIDNLTPAPPGRCEIVITMTIDQNGILTVNAREKMNENSRDLKVVYSKGHRSDKEISSVVADAKEHEMEDQEFLKLAENKLFLMNYCYSILYNFDEKQLTKIHESIYKRCQEILNLVENVGVEDKEHLDKLKQEITTACTPLEEKYKFEYMPNVNSNGASKSQFNSILNEIEGWNEEAS